jgi:hypothetical protein
VAVIADEPLDSPGHDHVVRGQGPAIPGATVTVASLAILLDTIRLLSVSM